MTKSISITPLILAAGSGSRSGLSYHKSLYRINGTSIISSIIKKIDFLDVSSTLVINQANESDFKKELSSSINDIEFIYQNAPLGMGDAILKFKDSKHYKNSDHILLSWGDLPFIKTSTFKNMVSLHIENNNDFTFITADSAKAYTRVIRNEENKVIDVIETRENDLTPKSGERDIGIFIFKTRKVLDMLERDLEGKFGKKTSEHSFLYIIKHLVDCEMKVLAYKLGSERELISLNTKEDIKKINYHQSDYL